MRNSWHNSTEPLKGHLAAVFMRGNDRKGLSCGHGKVSGAHEKPPGLRTVQKKKKKKRRFVSRRRLPYIFLPK